MFFGGGYEQKSVLYKHGIIRKIGKHCLCSEGEKSALSLTLSVFGKCNYLCDHTKSPNTARIGVSAGTWGKPKMALLLQKCHFGRGPRKGLTRDTQKLCSVENTIFIVCSAKHSLAEIEECQSKKITKNWGLFANMQKGVFFLFVFCFWELCFFFLFVFVLFLWRKPQRLSSCSLEVFSSFVPPKGLCLKSLSSSQSVFVLAFFLSSLSKFHHLSLFWSINPFLENIISFVCLPSFFAFSFVDVS